MEKTETRQKVYNLLKGASAAMLVTIGGSGRPQARPMRIARVDDSSGEIWFVTNKSGALVNQVEESDAALLLVQDGESAWLSLRGKARIASNKARELWKEPYRVWFPGGPDDPDLAAVAIDPVDAEYWDNRGSNKIEYIFEAARAYFTGSKPAVDEPGQHGKVSL